jgi:hypothetical protein
MARMIHSSNFYEAGFECFHDLAAFSICALFCEEVEDSDAMPVNFVNVPVGTFVIEENRYGRVDVLMRKFEWTARQCEQRWGRAALSKPMQELLLSDSGDRESRKFEILHCVFPRSDYKTGKMAAAKERPWASVYIDCAAAHVLEENGYYEQPFAVCRLGRGNNEIYGRGPADRAMPTIKTLQQFRRNMLLVGNKLINPTWLLAAGAEYLVDNRPGGRFYWDNSNPANRPERVPVEERIDWAQAYIESLRDEVRTAFYVPMFQMFTNPDEARRQKTAYEVQQMSQEKLLLFSPIFGRTAVEFFNPMLRRLFDVMLRRGLLDTPPGALEVLDYDVDYVSKIALAIKASQSGALLAMAQLAGQMAPLDPDAALVVNWGKASRGVMRNLGLPVEWQRSEDEVLQIKQAAAQAAAMQQIEQMAGAAQKAGAAAKNLGPDAQAAAMGALTQGGGA